MAQHLLDDLVVIHTQADVADQPCLFEPGQFGQGLVQHLAQHTGSAGAMRGGIDVMDIDRIKLGQTQALKAVLDTPAHAAGRKIPMLNKGQGVHIAVLLAWHLGLRHEQTPHFAGQPPGVAGMAA